ncbi:hypothetical protein HF1_01930 [Mycoplasma haemofelis str. Langford 1]|uniref:Uncharacterized protein n=1 Tax=Mycoplasma haemofelis (strain Langford 1) TaxID=941640 RepID=E8ZKN5_MYCHL|nr:hypothetical protein [Mycoplasma haemofelis]CBY92201.1 hypothetical protein HF1_01930 [Mycoplasma haemofelis str. Langford 1]
MNSFYLAKRGVRWAGVLDLINVSSWILLIFVVGVYHQCWLVPRRYIPLSFLSYAQSDASASYTWALVGDQGYRALFDYVIFDFDLFKVTMWNVVLPMFLVVLFSFITKILFGIYGIIVFMRARNVKLVYASFLVIFLPLVGGYEAIKICDSFENRLSHRYVASHSFMRWKVRKMWNGFMSAKFEDEMIKGEDY